jgi:hypothetical protein
MPNYFRDDAGALHQGGLVMHLLKPGAQGTRTCIDERKGKGAPVVKNYKGRAVGLMLNGMEGQVHYEESAWSNGAEPTAEISNCWPAVPWMSRSRSDPRGRGRMLLAAGEMKRFYVRQ